MPHLPPPIKHIIDILSDLPSIGPRQATRLAFYLVGQGKNAIETLASGVDSLKHIKTCSDCFFLHQNAHALCSICADPKRHHTTIAIVEKETDLLSLEHTKKFTGRYCIIGEIPKNGILEDWQKLRLEQLKSRIHKHHGGKIEEILLALNPTSSGDFHASLLMKELIPFAARVSRLGRGLPTGGEIEFADDETLGSALERRA